MRKKILVITIETKEQSEPGYEEGEREREGRGIGKREGEGGDRKRRGEVKRGDLLLTL